MMKPIFIIAGEKESGKTSFLLQLINLLRDKGRVVEGFVSLHDVVNDIYSIKNIRTNQEVPLMQRMGSFRQRPHHFTLFSKGVEVGKSWIDTLVQTPPTIAVLDEIGSYELSGELWCDGFTKLVKSALPILFTCKQKHLKAVLEIWNIEPTLIFYPDDFIDAQKAFEQMDGLL